ncbi:MAG: dTDP-4-dehydrorhamnose reductase [Candidatus Gastranaerophilales bacterium]|nr:dTDP-4-dehydrorhamnose reductase [Candidatus Gastranaerophilales bacterium]
MKILVTGASGLLGQELCPLLDEINVQYWATNSKIFDITNAKMVDEIMNKVNLDFIIHLAAYTNIDQAEVNSEEAFLVNHTGTKNMAKIAKKFDIPILYVSTSGVFDGTKSSPYKTTDQTNPINVYGMSKLKGEEEIRKITKKHYIIRTGALYGKGGSNYVDAMLTYSMFNSNISVVDDQVCCPTWTKDLSRQIIKIITENKPYGTYHISSSGHATWLELTKKIFELKKRNVFVTPIEKSDFPRPAKRPRFCVLDSENVLPSWEKSLEEYLLAK